ncbi:transglycosylase SLT domain-containing protein [Novosphingobium sp. FSY-8]|uniref:Transglycosylase SLT domain-containing protein n=1 Tax=Novosphingobium ovatum TaxID=1908523 RepID=A0ABW9X9W4_9SPHN|nr:lytic transglycosylase domain-containing protein [Novosphingobium ovatum]NBC35308.1 transglycosylase SLT domain-containing protein [Novosphingobium ovatum]
MVGAVPARRDSQGAAMGLGRGRWAAATAALALGLNGFAPAFAQSAPYPAQPYPPQPYTGQPYAGQAAPQAPYLVPSPMVQPIPAAPTPPPPPPMDAWDRARAAHLATPGGAMAGAIARWKQLAGTENQGFDAYAGFVMTYPGFPGEEAMRRAAEKALALTNVDTARLVAFFDRFPPLTNPARARYALALADMGRHEAGDVARAAWRGGVMSDGSEAAMLARWGSRMSQDDHDARLQALLWDASSAQATRALARASAPLRGLGAARLALQALGAAAPAPRPDVPMVGPDAMEQVAAAEAARAAAQPSVEDDDDGPTPTVQPLPAPGAMDPLAAPPADPAFMRDAGYVYDRARALIRRGRMADAAMLLASRPPLATTMGDARKWVTLHLVTAKSGGPSLAARIAANAVEGFAPNADISTMAFGVRDDFTTLMWLGGTSALWQLNDPVAAAPLFYRYGTAARSPQTRAKGFYWAGRAMSQAGRADAATRYFAEASQYADQFYGQLALERLGRPMPLLRDPPHVAPTPAQRAAFMARPIVQAVMEVSRDTEWQTSVRFFKEIASQGKTELDFVLLAELAQQIGRRDLAVIAGSAAGNAGLLTFRELAFPTILPPDGADWTVVHAISRQESQFAQNAISRAGARGLMQLMPTTAADQARKLGVDFSVGMLTSDPRYNMLLGDAFFARLMKIYDGCWPLAIAAYNAGPGNVRSWMGKIGDPRTPGTDWVQWIERIPISETRGYVTRVLENVVSYEAMYPDKAKYRGPNPASHYLGKDGPG